MEGLANKRRGPLDSSHRLSDLSANLRRLRSSFNRDVREGKLEDPAVAEKWIHRLNVLVKLCNTTVEELGISPRVSFLLASVENFRERVIAIAGGGR